MTNPNEERFDELWSDYLEGELDEAGIAELQRLMADDEQLLELATDTFQTHRLLGVLATRDSSDAFVEETLQCLPDSGEDFSAGVIKRLQPEGSATSKIALFPQILQFGGWAVAALLMVAFLMTHEADEAGSPTSRVQFSSLAQANFFGERTPSVKSNPELQRDYTLVSGSVELAFPAGAKTIVEAPAVFRVLSDDHLALDVGRCSVHAPDGAEGFRVDTPNGRVVDRGTRFFVNVSEASETEVQVVEGAADVHPGGENAAEKLHLTDGEARMIGYGFTAAVPFSPKPYRHGLPDRVISYQAEAGPDGLAKTLAGVTVQRGGKEHHYSAESLIPIELTGFHGGTTKHLIGHLVGAEGTRLPERRATLLEDFRFDTGVINPGGSPQPLSGPFDPNETPGFSVRFHQPVKNGPGPDIVFFEIQNQSNPPEGDAFHVSPLPWEDRLRSHTVPRYDLMVASADALSVSRRILYQSEEPVPSLANLESSPVKPSVSQLRFQAIAVGIDLSDLGYGPHETVQTLFFQDAMDDDNQVDPLVIVGLPSN